MDNKKTNPGDTIDLGGPTRYEIDYSKVKTVNDIKIIFKHMITEVNLWTEDDPNVKSLLPFLKKMV